MSRGSASSPSTPSSTFNFSITADDLKHLYRCYSINYLDVSKPEGFMANTSQNFSRSALNDDQVRLIKSILDSLRYFFDQQSFPEVKISSSTDGGYLLENTSYKINKTLDCFIKMGSNNKNVDNIIYLDAKKMKILVNEILKIDNNHIDINSKLESLGEKAKVHLFDDGTCLLEDPSLKMRDDLEKSVNKNKKELKKEEKEKKIEKKNSEEEFKKIEAEKKAKEEAERIESERIKAEGIKKEDERRIQEKERLAKLAQEQHKNEKSERIKEETKKKEDEILMKDDEKGKPALPSLPITTILEAKKDIGSKSSAATESPISKPASTRTFYRSITDHERKPTDVVIGSTSEDSGLKAATTQVILSPKTSAAGAAFATASFRNQGIAAIPAAPLALATTNNKQDRRPEPPAQPRNRNNQPSFGRRASVSQAQSSVSSAPQISNSPVTPSRLPSLPPILGSRAAADVDSESQEEPWMESLTASVREAMRLRRNSVELTPLNKTTPTTISTKRPFGNSLLARAGGRQSNQFITPSSGTSSLGVSQLAQPDEKGGSKKR